MLSPIVLFVYNRPDHTKAVIEHLANNRLAKESILFVFSDAANRPNQEGNVKAVRDYLKTISEKNFFADINVIEAGYNKGLAPSIISGVTEIINKYNKVIVVEDDSLTSPDFLDFMNDALDYYENKSQIWSIGGYSFIENFPSDYDADVYLMGRTCSYAWATWKNRWDKVDWNVTDYKRFKYSITKRREFDKYGNDRSLMLDAQQMGRVSSWAIRFCYAMHKNHMKTVYPRYTRVMNIGQDGSGVHFRKAVSGPRFITEEYIMKLHKIRCQDIQENEKIYEEFVKRFHLTPKKWIKKVIVNLLYKWFKIK